MNDPLYLSPEMLEALNKRCYNCGKNYGSHAPDPKYPSLGLLCPKQGPGYLLGVTSHIYVWKDANESEKKIME